MRGAIQKKHIRRLNYQLPDIVINLVAAEPKSL